MLRPSSARPPSQNHGTLITSMSACAPWGIELNIIRAEDFMRKYMWPNSCLPSATALISAVQTGSQGRFTLEGVENHAARKSSSRLLRRLWLNFDDRLSKNAQRVGKAAGSQSVPGFDFKGPSEPQRPRQLRGFQAKMALSIRVRRCWI